MSALEELEEERREKVTGIVEMAAREGWHTNEDGDELFCALHAPDGSRPVKPDDFEDAITDLECGVLTLECYHEDGCDCLGEWDLPVVPEPEEDPRW